MHGNILIHLSAVAVGITIPSLSKSDHLPWERPPLLLPWPPAALGRSGGGLFPNVPMVTHTGKTARFFDDVIKSEVVAINFIYTYCLNMFGLKTVRLHEVQRILLGWVGRAALSIRSPSALSAILNYSLFQILRYECSIQKLPPFASNKYLKTLQLIDLHSIFILRYP